MPADKSECVCVCVHMCAMLAGVCVCTVPADKCVCVRNAYRQECVCVCVCAMPADKSVCVCMCMVNVCAECVYVMCVQGIGCGCRVLLPGVVAQVAKKVHPGTF